MGSIKLLDCTLRDGGYVNNWEFGFNEISSMLDKMFNTEVDIVEAGFIRDVTYDKNRAVFPVMKDLDDILKLKAINKKNHMLAVMTEISNPIPLNSLVCSDKTEVDVVRVIIWKNKCNKDGKTVDALQESFEYCKGIAEKGYRLCIQPNRTDQYSSEEFEKMLRLFAQLKPYAIYVVDSWGTMYSSQVIHYMEIANRILDKDIAIGFHGHNNMNQAFATAERIIEKKYERDIIIDASVDGIGRGAGNLNLECIARYLNYEMGNKYNLEFMHEVYDEYIKALGKKYNWGASYEYFLSAINNTNPNYAAYFADKITLKQMQYLYDYMDTKDAVIFTESLAKKYRDMILGG